VATITGIQGIDVSNFQGAWDWGAWQGKIGFGMAKATEGDSFTDAWFAHNWDAMLALDRRMPRFAYSYFHPAQDPVVQAAHLVATVRGQGLLPGDNFVMDLEDTDGLPPATVARNAVTFLREVNELAPGHRVLVYTNPSFAAEGNCAGMGAWFLWIADYGVTRPAVPSLWPAATFWQWTDQRVDRDVFLGTQAELLAFTRMPAKR
jgi:GH25 family lysozyme M1 (1,4-beta-N-acetylmuramidase)